MTSWCATMTVTSLTTLAVTVDDADQGIGEVLRGADLLDTTPPALALRPPRPCRPSPFQPCPLMLGEDGERLAKRHGAITLEERIEAGEPGVSPQGVVRFG